MALIGITTVVLSLAVVVNIGASSLREKDLEYQAREQNLEKLEAKEDARTAPARGVPCVRPDQAVCGKGRQGKAGPGQKRRDFV